jgi:hypothetical protein
VGNDYILHKTVSYVTMEKDRRVMNEYCELFKNEPLQSTLWKASLYGFSLEGWMYFAVEMHKLEYMARAGILNGEGWFLRLYRIHEEAKHLNKLFGDLNNKNRETNLRIH